MLDPNKINGHDKISILILKLRDDCISRPLALIFHDCLETGVSAWERKKGTIASIHKKVTDKTLKAIAKFS